jgi:hypothetical protein
MSTPHPSGLPDWLVERLEEVRKNPGISNATVDKILQPMWTKDESPPPRGTRVYSNEKSASIQSRRSGKAPVEAERGTDRDEVIEMKRRPSAPNASSSRPTNPAAKLAVNTKLPKRAPGKARCEDSAAFGLPSPAESNAAETSLMHQEPRVESSKANAEAKFSAFEQPAWYKSINTNSPKYKVWLKKRNTQADVSLSRMKECIKRCEDTRTPPKELPKIFNELRNEIHKAEITIEVDEYLLRKNMMLHNTGIVGIFISQRVEYPWDIRVDASQLYNRWKRQDFKINILRHIVTKREGRRNTDSIDPDWLHSADYYGEGGLVLGQWWPTQLCTVRDSAHGAAQGGIYGHTGRGVFSIVLSGGEGYGYNDEDNGDDIWYSGTVSKDPTNTLTRNLNNNGQNLSDANALGATNNTRMMIESCDKVKNDVRVIRSHNLPKSNVYRPEVGFRYDGLYKVIAYELVDRAKSAYRFNLKRCPGQHPIRYEDNAARRPTVFEIAEYRKLKLDN